MIKRILDIKDFVEAGKVLMIYGPRQVGKTTLVQNYLTGYKDEYLFKTGDDIPFSNDLAKCDLELLKRKIPENTLLIIDEAQKIPNIGRALKLIVDNIQNVKIIVTGSSSFDLMNYTGEALTGRKHVATLYPISIQEALSVIKVYDLDNAIKDFMVYGMYPRVLSEVDLFKREQVINDIANSYLMKDILEFNRVKNSQKIFDLLRLLAYQLGGEVSTTELASRLDLDKNTVAHYLDLLEKSFVIFRLGGFSRNLRKEVYKMSKYYFYDLGVRNSLIANFNELDVRNDVGELWENFMILERMKKNAYARKIVNYYFWRTYDGQEVDLIEESGGRLVGYEFKWRKKNVVVPKDWLKNYADASFEVVNSDNFRDFAL